MIYRIKGSDLQAYRSGRIDRDEVRKRVPDEPILEESEIVCNQRSETVIGVLESRHDPLARARPPSSFAALLSISCGASVDAVAALEPLDVVTGWFDDGIIEGGKNKLVPSVTLKLRNKTDQPS